MENLNLINLKLSYSSSHLDCDKCSELTGNQSLSEKFIELSMDEESEEFINSCFNSKFQLLKATYFIPWLTYFYSLPDANALLGTGRMFMFSKDHLTKLFDGEKFDTMLDIGAGDGYVTKQFRSIVTGKITCTETAPKMVKVLSNAGYELTDEIKGEFDIVSCLNVLDRCDRPLTILKNILNVKKKYAIVSIVLPFRGFYYEGVKKLPQIEHLIDYYKHWEENVNILFKIFTEMGFRVHKIAKVPYLSEGNYRTQLYSLDTAVFIMSNININI